MLQGFENLTGEQLARLDEMLEMPPGFEPDIYTDGNFRACTVKCPLIENKVVSFGYNEFHESPMMDRALRATIWQSLELLRLGFELPFGLATLH